MKVSVAQYAKTLLELTDGKSEQEVSDIVSRFARTLKDEVQIKNSPKIIEKFSFFWNEKHGIVEAEVISSRKLSIEQESQITDFVKDKYNAKKVEIENVIDEKIKGGIVIKVGDEVMDGSIEQQLKKLKKQLIS